MSEISASKVGTGALPGPPGIALKCQLLCEALAERGAQSAGDLLDELNRRLATEGAQSVTSIREDLRTLRAGKWIAPTAADPERFELIDDPTAG